MATENYFFFGNHFLINRYWWDFGCTFSIGCEKDIFLPKNSKMAAKNDSYIDDSVNNIHILIKTTLLYEI